MCDFEAWEGDGLPRWGVPDWHGESGYPAPNKSTLPQMWAWQFLRRNPEYRTFWEEKIQPLIDETFVPGPLVLELGERFGLMWMPPSPSAQFGSFFKAAGTRELRRWSSGGSYELNLKEHEVAYIFNMSLPLEAQFQRALTQAKAFQEHKKRKGILTFNEVRQHVDKYVTYLRILDADDAGVSNEEIEEVIFHNLSNIYPEKQRTKTLLNYRRAARKLRDNGYRGLAGALS